MLLNNDVYGDVTVEKLNDGKVRIHIVTYTTKGTRGLKRNIIDDFVMTFDNIIDAEAWNLNIYKQLDKLHYN